jgi:hypothetical protein
VTATSYYEMSTSSMLCFLSGLPIKLYGNSSWRPVTWEGERAISRELGILPWIRIWSRAEVEGGGAQGRCGWRCPEVKLGLGDVCVCGGGGDDGEVRRRVRRRVWLVGGAEEEGDA